MEAARRARAYRVRKRSEHVLLSASRANAFDTTFAPSDFIASVFAARWSTLNANLPWSRSADRRRAPVFVAPAIVDGFGPWRARPRVALDSRNQSSSRLRD